MRRFLSWWCDRNSLPLFCCAPTLAPVPRKSPILSTRRGAKATRHFAIDIHARNIRRRLWCCAERWAFPLGLNNTSRSLKGSPALSKSLQQRHTHRLGMIVFPSQHHRESFPLLLSSGLRYRRTRSHARPSWPLLPATNNHQPLRLVSFRICTYMRYIQVGRYITRARTV